VNSPALIPRPEAAYASQTLVTDGSKAARIRGLPHVTMNPGPVEIQRNIPPDRRIPTLDGWRGIAVFMVILSHLEAGYLVGRNWGSSIWNTGQHGVQIFFVLSGYLITSTLLREQRIKLGNFYLRRFFRLMPAAWTYLLVLGLLTLFTHMKTLGGDLWACLFFFRNYIPETRTNTCTEHFWSLSLEEQFYLAWPPVLALLGRKRAAIAAAAAVLAIAVYRYFFIASTHNFYSFQHTEFRADGLLVGCLLALVLANEPARLWLQRYARVVFWLCLAPLAWDIYKYSVDGFMSLNESILLALMIGSTSLEPATLPGRVLESQHLKAVGIMSYSIYLWQGLFFRANWGYLGPLLFAASFMLSWRFLEQPGIALGRRILARLERSDSAESVALAS
jgi:peptidoglycan/LPS O-acetylase OafA/YrhL